MTRIITTKEMVLVELYGFEKGNKGMKNLRTW
jgi:hypothetical protein